jgi:hypothetical protein
MKEPEVLAATTTATNPTWNHHCQKVTATTEGLPPNCFHHLHDRVLCARSKGKENAMTICDYISSLKSEINLSDHYRNDTIMRLCNLSVNYQVFLLSIHLRVDLLFKVSCIYGFLQNSELN